MEPKPRDLTRLTQRQHGVVSRAQVLALGGDDEWIRGRLRSGLWIRRIPGVYRCYTGSPSWKSRAMEALLHAGPDAALSHRSAGYRHEMVERAPTVIEVSVPHSCRRRSVPGIRVHRRRTMPAARGLPRSTVPEETFVDLAGRAGTVDDLVGLITRALRRVRVELLREAVARRPKLPNRALLTEIIGAVEDGVESPLEYRYHVDVERPHGLPCARLQRRELLDGLYIRADRVYEGHGVRVELDGQLAHPGGRTDRDVWRDNAVLVHADDLTLRYRWTHVAGTPCRTARQVGQALQVRGWRGAATPCGPDCVVGR